MYVYSDSVLCLGKVDNPEDATKKWEQQVATLEMYHTFREMQGPDGELIDFECKNFLGATALDLRASQMKEDFENTEKEK